VHHLNPGICLADLADLGISISRQSALTAIEGEAFLRLKAALQRAGAIPAFPANALPGGGGFRGVNAANWRRIACAPEQRFIHEAHVRQCGVEALGV
jgi:hypothetical protein